MKQKDTKIPYRRNRTSDRSVKKDCSVLELAGPIVLKQVVLTGTEQLENEMKRIITFIIIKEYNIQDKFKDLCCKVQNIIERNERKSNKWKKNPLFMDWKTYIVKVTVLPQLYCRANATLSKSQLQFLQKLATWSLNSYGNSENPEQPKQSSKRANLEDSHCPIQNLPQTECDQGGVVLAQGRTHSPMEYNCESRNKPICLHSIII